MKYNRDRIKHIALGMTLLVVPCSGMVFGAWLVYKALMRSKDKSDRSGINANANKGKDIKEHGK